MTASFLVISGVSSFALGAFIIAFALIVAFDSKWKSEAKKELLPRNLISLRSRFGQIIFNAVRFILLFVGVFGCFVYVHNQVGQSPSSNVAFESGTTAGISLLIMLFFGAYDRLRIQRKVLRQSAKWLNNYEAMLLVLRRAAESSQGRFIVFSEVEELMKKGQFEKADEKYRRSNRLSRTLGPHVHLEGIVEALLALGQVSNDNGAKALQALKNVRRSLEWTTAYIDACVAGLIAVGEPKAGGEDDAEKITDSVVEQMKGWEDWRLRLQIARNYTLLSKLDEAKEQISKFRDVPQAERRFATKELSRDVLLSMCLGRDYIDRVLKDLRTNR